MATKEGDAIFENLEASPEEEEITLSDTELDDVLNSAEITTEGGGDSLEQYGVWVKSEPQDIDAPAEADLDFELADLGPGAQADLTEEEEQLLGELEGEPDAGEGLSVLENDLEALGGPEDATKGALEVDIEDLGTQPEGSTSQPEELELAEMPEEFPDLEAETLEGLDSLDEGESVAVEVDREAEIEVPLSDRAAVEEHYEDLAAVEGVPSTPGMSPPNILERIEKDLNQIKAEIQNLKNELAGFAGGAARQAEVKPAPAAAGSFEKGEDDTIALTGDELDNILNTADITEEMAEPADEGSLEGLDELDSLRPPEELELEEAPAAEPVPDAAADMGAELAADEDILAPGSLEAEEGSLEEVGAAEEEPLELVPEAEEEPLELGSEAGAGPDEIQLQAEEVPELAGEMSLEEEAGPLEDLEALGELEVPEMPEAEQPGTDELALESSMDEVSLSLPAEDLAAEELAVEELPTEELPMEELPAEELSIEELSPADEPLEPLVELEPSEQMPEIELAAEPEGLEAAEEEEPATTRSGVGALPKDLQSDIRSVLSYLDQLLEALPNEKIQEFAQSQYFGIYKRLFEELGLGA